MIDLLHLDQTNVFVLWASVVFILLQRLHQPHTVYLVSTLLDYVMKLLWCWAKRSRGWLVLSCSCCFVSPQCLCEPSLWWRHYWETNWCQNCPLSVCGGEKSECNESCKMYSMKSTGGGELFYSCKEKISDSSYFFVALFSRVDPRRELC